MTDNSFKSTKPTVLYIAWLILTVLGFLVFFNKRGADHESHIEFAQAGVQTLQYPPHFLYHYILNLLTGFSGDFEQLHYTAIFVLTIGVSLKIALSIPLINRLARNQKSEITPLMAGIILGALFFISPIVNWWQFPYIYRGQFTPNIWHNPTIILLMPFALIIILISMNEDKFPGRFQVYASLLLALSTLMKPNFAMAFLPSLLVLAVMKQYSRRKFCLYLLPALCILFWQFMRTFAGGADEIQPLFKSEIIISPMTVWFYFTRIPGGSLLVSFAFPFTFIYCFGTFVKNKRIMGLAWLMLFVSMTQFLLLAEKAWFHRMYAGNFIWGTVPSLYLIFMISMVEMILLKPEIKSKKQQFQYALCLFFLACHFLSGIMFYVRSLMDFDFYA